jgi:hypothetical protein
VASSPSQPKAFPFLGVGTLCLGLEANPSSNWESAGEEWASDSHDRAEDNVTLRHITDKFGVFGGTPVTMAMIPYFALLCVVSVCEVQAFVVFNARQLEESLSVGRSPPLEADNTKPDYLVRHPQKLLGSNRKNQFGLQGKAVPEAPDIDVLHCTDGVNTSSKASRIGGEGSLDEGVNDTMQRIVLDKPQLTDPNNTLAVEFFANPYFYANGTCDYDHAKLTSDNHRRARERVFRNCTVQRFLSAYNNGLYFRRRFGSAGIDGEKVFSYGSYTVEDKLHDCILPLSGLDEIDRANERFVPLSSWDSLLPGLAWNMKSIFYIWGPSGCGKTLFSVKQAATYLASTEKLPLYTTIYVKLTEISFNAPDHRGLLKWIQDELSRRHPEYNRNRKLKMHVTLVLDDVGCASVDSVLGLNETVRHVYSLMSKRLAKSVRLIVCGTGLTVKQPAGEDVLLIRMNQWNEADVRHVAAERFQLPPYRAAAILRIHVLAVLSSNARMACILLETAAEIYSVNYNPPISVFNWIEDRVPDIVHAAVEKFIGESVLRDVSPLLRRRVAAWVFYMDRNAGAESRKSHCPQGLYVPEHEGLTEDLKDLACGFVEWNVMYVDGKPTRAFKHQKPSGWVSEPLAIVLSTVLGASPTVWVGGCSSGVFALQAQAISGIAQYLKAFEERGHATMNELDELLSLLSLVKSLKRVPEPRAGAGSVSVPVVPGTTTWMNARGAPFANVVAPFTLYKHVHGDAREDVDIFDELAKCGLLKPEVVPTIFADEGKTAKRAAIGSTVLAGICAGWQGTIPIDDSLNATSTASMCSKGAQKMEKSLVYDAFHYVRANEDVLVGTQDGLADVIDAVPCIRTVFHFRGRGVNLRTGLDSMEGRALRLSFYQVDADGKVLEELLNPEQKFQWGLLTQALGERLRENVEIRFVHQPPSGGNEHDWYVIYIR